jgi:hypothetical protein
MSSEEIVPDRRLFPLLLKGYFLGTFASALVLLVAVAIISPGDGGTWAALNSGLFVPMLFVLGAINLIVFPLAAIASWPLRALVLRKPLPAFLSAGACGIGIGAIASEVGLRGGPGHIWPGPLVGFTYAVVWFLTVWREAKRTKVRHG